MNEPQINVDHFYHRPTYQVVGLLTEKSQRARQVAASRLDDPTWLAYAVYGDPRATVSPRP